MKVMKGDEVMKALFALAEGESMLVGLDAWTAFEGFFEKAADYGDGDSYLVYLDCLDEELDEAAEYEVTR